MKTLFSALILLLAFTGVSAHAQIANDTAMQNAILEALPDGVTPDKATADEIAQAAVNVLFDLDGSMEERENNAKQIMVSLGELTRAGTFKNAPRFGNYNPTARFYTKALNMASSALDVTYTTYHGFTVQHIIGLTAAMREGQNFLNGAKSNAITRK